MVETVEKPDHHGVRSEPLSLVEHVHTISHLPNKHPVEMSDASELTTKEFSPLEKESGMATDVNT